MGRLSLPTARRPPSHHHPASPPRPAAPHSPPPGSGPAGIGALRCAVEWQPVAAHAGVRSVSAFLAAPSAAGAPFIADFDRWREAGIRLFTLYGPGGAAKIASELAPGRIGDFVGEPRKASALIGGVEGARGEKMRGSRAGTLTRSRAAGRECPPLPFPPSAP